MLSLQGVSHRFRKVVALKDVSFFIRSGEIVGLLGPNGAGKTTAFTLMVGLLPIQKGKILLGDGDITRWSVVKRANAGIIYMPQDSCLFTRLSVRDNILAILEFYPHLYRQRERILERVFQQLQIAHLHDRMAGVLSGGERRRVEMARALALSPKFLLLDEPFSGVDPISVSEIKRIISQLTELGIGILVTDHNVRDTLKVCHRAYLVYKGEILISGAPHDIGQSHVARQFYLGSEFEL